MKEYTFDNAETRYKIETINKRELELYLNANKLVCVLYDFICWKRAIYNGKNYGEGHVLYKGNLYKKNEWERIKHAKDEYDEKTHLLKEKAIYLYTEDDLEHKLNELLDNVSDLVNNYIE